jgi:hypothetical protein
MIVEASANRPKTTKELRLRSLAMGYPSYPAPQPKPRVATHDLLISVGALVLTAAVGAVAAAMGVFSLAFLDHCPPASCSVDGAVTAVGTALLIAFGIGVAGLIVTVVQLIRRKPGWPFALGTFALCVVAIFFGGVGYAAAVG